MILATLATIQALDQAQLLLTPLYAKSAEMESSVGTNSVTTETTQ